MVIHLKGDDIMDNEIITRIVIGALLLLIALPSIGWRIYTRRRFSEDMKEFVSKPFVCPNCGFRFYIKSKVVRPIGKDRAYLKCPSCGKRDLCKRPYDLDYDQ